MTAAAETMDVASLPAPEPVSPGVVVHRDVMVAMRDGIRLAADIYRPAHDGRVVQAPLPVILERTAYGKGERSRSEIEVGMSKPMTRAEVATHFACSGYVVIYQDCRGRYGSEGEFTKYLSEGPDGYDTLAWIVEQPWSDGKVGTMGLSYAAHTQMALACLNPPGLAAMVLDSGGFSNAFTCGIRQGGAFELKQATWAYNNARESVTAKQDPNLLRALEAEDIRTWFNAMPWSEKRSPVRWIPEYEDYLLEQWRHGTFDDYWKQPGIYAVESYDAFPKVPVALLSSWYDAYVRTTFENYEGLGRDQERPLALLMGPNLHGNRNATFAGDVEFGAAAPLGGNITESWLEFRRRWFDRWLKGIDNGVGAEPRARLFLMGGGSGRKTAQGRLDHGGRWIASTDWPVPGTQETVLNLHENGSLSADGPAPGSAPFVYDFDPKNPVPTIGGALTSGQPVFEGGGFDQREQARFFGCSDTNLPLSARLDVLSFETEPFDEDTAVIGPVTVELFASTDGADTDFTAKLIDVYPPSEDYPTGFTLILTDGIFRCRYRNGFDAPEPCVPGEVMQITIEPFATANLFKKGHRLRLDISSSNFPKFDVNPNTGAPEGRGRAKRVARNMVYCDQTRASHIRLRTIAANALRELVENADE